MYRSIYSYCIYYSIHYPQGENRRRANRLIPNGWKKRLFYVSQLEGVCITHHRDDVKPYGRPQRNGLEPKVRIGTRNDVANFTSAHRIFRISEESVATGLYLYKHQRLSIHRYYVQILTTRFPIAFQNTVSKVEEISRGPLLSPDTQFIMLRHIYLLSLYMPPQGRSSQHSGTGTGQLGN